MKINSMKLLIIILEILLMSGVILGLYFIEIPVGNREVSYVILGALVNNLGHSINSMFKKGAINE